MKKNSVKKTLSVIFFFINAIIYAQEADGNESLDDAFYYDFGMAEGMTIYGERPKEFGSESIEAYVLNQLNGITSNRKQFIETDFLEEAGFRRTGNVKYRKTTASEKASSVLYGVFHAFSLGFVPQKPFSEIEYAELRKGKYYAFESIISTSKYKNISPEVLTVLKLEYILQIEFCNGIIIRDTINYYTDENINKFEELILTLPDFPESIGQLKTRYLNELPKIRASLERHRNPSENNVKALQNLQDTLRFDIWE